MVEKKAQTSYDEVPYVSNAYSYASPETYYSVAKLFGLNPKHPSEARILELGCASGGNIIGVAARYPKAEFIGVDLSSVQIEMGQKHIKGLGLKNIELKAMSILDIDASFGEFDYIICHGVFAWVPKEVQDKILEICEKNLSDTGVAHVSYNTLPGWNVPSSFREMMAYHASSFEDSKEKIMQSRALINFIQESLSESKTPYAELLSTEADHISKAEDSYVLHEYIDKGNSNFYFSDFMKLAANHNLTYLADSNVATMYLGNLPAKASKKLAEIPDIIRTEQYMDFVSNRRFRNTLLCKNVNKIQRNINSDSLDNAYLSIKNTPEVSKDKVDFSKELVDVNFKLEREMNCNVTNPVQAAMLYVLSEESGNISVSDLFKKISKLCPNFDSAKDGKVLLNQVVEFVFKNIAKFSFVEPQCASKISNKPKVFEVARYQAEQNLGSCINCNNDSIGLDDLKTIIFKNADGTKTKEDIAKVLDLELKNSGKQMHQNGKTVTDEKLRSKILDEIVESHLQFALNYGLLVE